MNTRLKFNFLTFLFLFFCVQVFSQNSTNQSKEITNLIAKKRNFNKKYGYGYRIQLYNGGEQQARKMRAKFRVTFPGNKIKLVYKSPEWKVQVGDYKTKLEADRDLIKFREKFSGIIVVPMGK